MRNKALFLTLSLLLITSSFAVASPKTEIFTLEDALNRVNYHSDVEAWKDNLESTEKVLQGFNNKQMIGLNVGGRILSNNYNLDNEYHSFSTSQTLSISKSNLSGTNLNANFTPNWSYNTDPEKGSSISSSWSLSLDQTLWPPAKLNSDQISLTIAEQNKSMLERQKNYVLENAKFKIEELYHTAQLGEEKVLFAQESLANAKDILEIAIKKRELDEASESEIVSAQIGVLRAERELEASLKTAKNAKENLITSLDLDGDFELEKIELKDIQRREINLNLNELTKSIETHPLVQHYLVDLRQANLELEATIAAEKPKADLGISFDDKKVFTAYVTIGHAILDKNQRVTTRESREKSLEDLEEVYKKALEKLVEQIEEADENIQRLERDLEISTLTLRQAQLELDVAKERFEKGIIDQTTLDGAQTKLRQANLDYYEVYFTYDLTMRRLSLGILGDLPLTGGSR